MKDLTGRVFGFLKVIGRHDAKKDYWVCECKCGAIRHVFGGDLTRTKRKGTTGCYSCSAKGKRVTHGLSKSKEYRVWASMVSRCKDPGHSSYRWYGARGVVVDSCFTGKDGFKNFIAEVGNCPIGKTLDRIDVLKGYVLGNLRWATPAEQNRNLARNRWIRVGDETLCLKDACAKAGITATRVRSCAARKNISFQEAFDFIVTK